MSQVSVQTYTGITAELNAMRTGSLDVASGIDLSQLALGAGAQVAGDQRVRRSAAGAGSAAMINFKDTTNHFDKIIAQLYVRQAIDHLINQPAIVKGIYKGAAVPAYGADAVGALLAVRPGERDHAAVSHTTRRPAVALLQGPRLEGRARRHDDVRQAGHGGRRSAAPASRRARRSRSSGPTSPSRSRRTGALESEAIASEAKQAAGINIQLQTKTFNFLTANYNDANPAAAKYTNDWGVNNYGGCSPTYYPTARRHLQHRAPGSTPAPTATRTANALINASVHSGRPERGQDRGRLLRRATRRCSSCPTTTTCWRSTPSGSAGPPDGWTSLTQQQWYPAVLVREQEVTSTQSRGSRASAA